MYIPTELEELFLEYLGTSPSVAEASRKCDISAQKGYTLSSKLKDTIQQRARDQLTVASLRAVHTITSFMDAGAATEKGELRLKASESVLDRSGVTKHTNVDVQVKAENGIFLLPTKTDVPDEDLDSTEIPGETNEPEGNP